MQQFLQPIISSLCLSVMDGHLANRLANRASTIAIPACLRVPKSQNCPASWVALQTFGWTVSPLSPLSEPLGTARTERGRPDSKPVAIYRMSGYRHLTPSYRCKSFRPSFLSRPFVIAPRAV